MSTLVIVESPGKIKKITEILGNEYTILASNGHIIDLPKTKKAINTHTFEPEYININNKTKIINLIKNEYTKCTNILIATDKDREGEMIAWSISRILNLDLNNKNRIIFSSITKKDIINAINDPKQINTNIVDSQKTRRMIDRILGFELSPLLWRMMKNNKNTLSAGRVQSVVVKLIVERENEINSYKYIDNPIYKTFIICHDNYTNNDILFNGYTECDKNNAVDIITKIDSIKITNIDISEHKHNPPPPYTTSTLQQDAYNKFGFNAKQTMAYAQKLYESGCITYMRTDSTNISNEANEYIKKYMNNKNYNYNFRKYKSHGDAHEAIRPTIFDTNISNPNEKKLFELIKNRTIGSFMDPLIKIKVNIDIITNNNCEFNGFIEFIKDPGYMKLYGKNANIYNNLELINLGLIDKYAKQIYNKPVFRYNEAILINKLDPNNMNIGRPSTYASIISKIVDKGYVEIKNIDGTKINLSCIDKNGIETFETICIGAESNKFVPTKLGCNIVKFLDNNFPKIMDYTYTSQMENKLDNIADGIINYKEIIHDFYDDFMIYIKKLSPIEQEKNGKLIGCDDKYKYILTDKNIICKPSKGKIIYLDNNNENLSVDILREMIDKKQEFPKLLGNYENNNVILNKSLTGYYISYGTTFIKIDHEVELNDAIELINKRRENIITEFNANDINYCIINGPYGLYVRKNNGKTQEIIKLPKNININNIDEITNLKKKNTRKYKKK